MWNQFLETVLQLDYKIIHWVNQVSVSEWQDQFFPSITDLHKSPYFMAVVIPIVVFCFYKKFKRTGLSLFLILILALAFGDFAGRQVKNHYLRPRPFQNIEIHVTQKSPAGSKSFYSNHASNMFTFASYTSAFFPVATIPLYTLAATVSYSRIYNGVHYPSDVFAGGVMGLIWGLFFSSIAKRIFKKIQIVQKKDSDESSSNRS